MRDGEKEKAEMVEDQNHQDKEGGREKHKKGGGGEPQVCDQEGRGRTEGENESARERIES